MPKKVIEYYPRPRKNLPAKPDSWHTEPLPAKRTTIHLDRAFTAKEMLKMQHGYVAEEMEDKWFIYWKDHTLFFHRSWTGHCIYIVRFTAEGDGYRMVEAQVNRDPDQYRESSDKRDAAMISYLIDVLLLHKWSEFPSDETDPEKRALMNWSEVGRAMLEPPEEDE